MAKRKNKTLSNLPEVLIITGLFLVGLSATHNYIRFRSLSLNEKIISTHLSTQINQSEFTPVHIFIPWNTDAQISPQVYDSGKWTISPDAVSYLTSSGVPGQVGNIILYGHNQRNILGNIRVLKGGETITLTLKDGKIRKYIVNFAVQTSPDSRTDLLSATDTEVLTLFTCAGPFDSQRYVVRATPAKDQDAF